MLLLAMLALALAVVAPAVAQVSNEVGGNEAGSGDVSLNFSPSNTSSNGSQCVTANQFGNTANNQNAQGTLQYGSTTGDTEFESGALTAEPSNTQTCDQTVQQASAASGG